MLLTSSEWPREIYFSISSPRMVSISRTSAAVGGLVGIATWSLLREFALLLWPTVAAGREDGRRPTIDDGELVEKAPPSWTAQAATTRLTKKDFIL